jgi:hypothetical protein
MTEDDKRRQKADLLLRHEETRAAVFLICRLHYTPAVGTLGHAV